MVKMREVMMRFGCAYSALLFASHTALVMKKGRRVQRASLFLHPSLFSSTVRFGITLLCNSTLGVYLPARYGCPAQIRFGGVRVVAVLWGNTESDSRRESRLPDVQMSRCADVAILASDREMISAYLLTFLSSSSLLSVAHHVVRSFL